MPLISGTDPVSNHRTHILAEDVESFERNRSGETFINLRSGRQHTLKGPIADDIYVSLIKAFGDEADVNAYTRLPEVPVPATKKAAAAA